MKKPVKSFQYSDPSTIKVGDEVYVGDMEMDETTFKDKCSECYFTIYPERIRPGMMIIDEPCEAHKTYELIHRIASQKMLRIEQWRDPSDNGAWRAGIEWYDGDDYEFICEYKSIVECLEKITKNM